MDIKKCKYKIIIDTREKSIKHILNKFEEGFENKPSEHDFYRGKESTYSGPVEYYIQEKGLKTGDYTIAIQLPNKEVINFQDKIVIERKADLNEVCCNLFDAKSKDKDGLTRFERELKRAYEQGIKVHLLVEVSGMYSKMLSGKHFRYDTASKVNPASFEAMFQALMTRYNVSVWDVDKKDSARVIHSILYYGAREYLKGIEQGC